ncbi:MAG: YHS domain-containing (seleno)protein [Chryseolinea sp.]
MNILRILIFAFIPAVLAGELFAQVKNEHLNLKDGLAIEGYDPVAYFVTGKAIDGKNNLSAKVDQITYRFSSAANRELFLKDPQKYQPQYGGWCAYAMGDNGDKVEVDPETFKIIDNKLYLFYNAYFNNTLKKWNADEGNLKKNADLNWKKTIK